MRHAARSHYLDTRKPEFWGNIERGHLTTRGRWDQMEIGKHRKHEYVDEKGFVSEDYDPEEFLSISTFYERCRSSGEYYLRGMFPYQDLANEGSLYTSDSMPNVLRNTGYERILKHIESTSN